MSNIENLKNRISQVIIRDLELNISQDEIQSASRLDELFGMDSIAIVELVVGVEKEFDIKIPPEYLTVEMFQNLSTLAEHIYTLIHGKENKKFIEQGK
jgi:acyl carrier protein